MGPVAAGQMLISTRHLGGLYRDYSGCWKRQNHIYRSIRQSQVTLLCQTCGAKYPSGRNLKQRRPGLIFGTVGEVDIDGKMRKLSVSVKRIACQHQISAPDRTFPSCEYFLTPHQTHSDRQHQLVQLKKLCSPPSPPSCQKTAPAPRAGTQSCPPAFSQAAYRG